MPKSIKFKNNTYLDSRGIVHNKELLSDKLNKAPHLFRVGSGTYRIKLVTYKAFIMFGIYGGKDFFASVCFIGNNISIRYLGDNTLDLKSNFKFVGNGVWDLVSPTSSDFDILGANILSVTQIS